MLPTTLRFVSMCAFVCLFASNISTVAGASASATGPLHRMPLPRLSEIKALLQAYNVQHEPHLEEALLPLLHPERVRYGGGEVGNRENRMQRATEKFRDHVLEVNRRCFGLSAGAGNYKRIPAAGNNVVLHRNTADCWTIGDDIRRKLSSLHHIQAVKILRELWRATIGDYSEDYSMARNLNWDGGVSADFCRAMIESRPPHHIVRAVAELALLRSSVRNDGGMGKHYKKLAQSVGERAHFKRLQLAALEFLFGEIRHSENARKLTSMPMLYKTVCDATEDVLNKLILRGFVKGRLKSFSGASLLDRACRRECCILSHMMTGLSVLWRGDLFGILSCIRSCILSHIWSDPGAICDGGDHRGSASDFCRLGGHFGSSSPSGTLPCVVLYLVSYFVLYLVSET